MSGSSTTVPVGPSYPAFQPIVAADGNQNGVDGQTDANANVNGSGFGAVYVAFAMESVAPSTSTVGSYAAIYMMASADGGNRSRLVHRQPIQRREPLPAVRLRCGQCRGRGAEHRHQPGRRRHRRPDQSRLGRLRARLE